MIICPGDRKPLIYKVEKVLFRVSLLFVGRYKRFGWWLILKNVLGNIWRRFSFDKWLTNVWWSSRKMVILSLFGLWCHCVESFPVKTFIILRLLRQVIKLSSWPCCCCLFMNSTFGEELINIFSSCPSSITCAPIILCIKAFVLVTLWVITDRCGWQHWNKAVVIC